jgi:predicted membrane channel-forming protein YqfA (hemolysin III family)
MWVMLAVFLVLVIGAAIQGMSVIVNVILVAGLLLLLGGVYYATGREDGVTFREAVFNWPLVIVAAIAVFVSLL